MKTLEEVLEILDEQIDRPTLEEYIARQWIRPHRKKTDWHFEEIDIARLQLVCHLTQDIEVNVKGWMWFYRYSTSFMACVRMCRS